LTNRVSILSGNVINRKSADRDFEIEKLSVGEPLEMPICEQIYKVLYEGKSAKESAMALLGREQTTE
jgi:glycerol-3-phosphate dehydrogenase